MKRLLISLFAIAVLVVLCAIAAPARAGGHDKLPLRPGSAGPRVAGLQWMLSGAHSHKPNVFTIAGTFKGKPNGYLGARTETAIYAYKYRLGYPAKYNSKTHPIAGTYFFALLHGTKTRPPSWVANAAARVRTVEAGPTKIAIAVRSIELSQLGVTEIPASSNCGPTVRIYQTVTGAFAPDCRPNNPYGAWCVSFTQWAFLTAGYGTFLGDTASVYQAVDRAAVRQWLHAVAKVGAIAAFIDYYPDGRTRIPGTGHMGTVVKVEANSFTYIAGNDGNAVREHTIADGSRSYVFIYLPRVA